MRARRTLARRLPRHPGLDLPRGRRWAATGLAGWLLGLAGCGNKIAVPTEAADTKSTDGKSDSTGAAISSVLSSLHLPTNLGELVTMLKNGAVIKALKEAFAKGTCKSEIQAVVTAGQAMVVSLIKAGLNISALLGNKTSVGNIDFSSIEPSLTALGQCAANAAPEVLTSIENSLSSSSTSGTQKLAGAAEGEGVLTEADVEALDISRWPTSESELNEAGPAGDPGVPAEAR